MALELERRIGLVHRRQEDCRYLTNVQPLELVFALSECWTCGPVA